jgi:hypothetical protein
MFEFVRRFRKWVMIGTVILVSFAFGITGVVYSVLAPSRDPGEEVAGSYSLSAVKGSDQKVSVKRREIEQFQRRWDQFLIEHLNRSQMPFGRFMKQGGRMYQMAIRMTMRRAMQQNPFFRFIPYVQSRYGVDLIRNLLFLRSADNGAGQDVVRLVPFENENMEELSQQQKVSMRQRHWSRESVWRLRYVLDLARNAGFSTTDQEIADVVQPFLNQINQRGRNRIGYRQFVEQQGRMSLDEFETTLAELITILKYLSSISRSTAVEGSSLLSGFNSEQGYGALLLTNIDHDMVRRSVFGSRNWSSRQRFLSRYPTEGYVDAFREFSSNLGSEDSNRSAQQRGQNEGGDTSSLEKRQFAYLYLPIDAYRESVSAPSEERLQSYYENNKSEEFQRSGGGSSSTSNDATNGGSQQNGKDGEQFLPFDQVKEEIRERLIDKRALRKADADLKGLINSTISRKEIRGEPIDFKQIADQADLKGDLQYRESPLLDRDDMSHFLKHNKGVEQSHLDMLNKFVYERELGSDGGPGPYPQEPIWFERGVVLPRLVRVESDVLVSSAASGGLANAMVLSEFQETYPLPSLQLRDRLRWTQLEQATLNQVNQLQQRVVRQYQSDRDERWEEIEVMGPPVPPEYMPFSSSPSENGDKTLSGQTDEGSKDGEARNWPPGTFRNEVANQDLLYQRRRWMAARDAFTSVVKQTGLELQETKLFKLGEGPSDVDVQQSIRQRLSGNQRSRRRRGNSGPAELFEPLLATGEGSSQIAILHKKLPKSEQDLKTFLEQQRRAKIMSERSSYLRTNVVTLFEQADLSLTSAEESGTASSSGQ